MAQTVAQRFWAKVDISGECWEWVGAYGSHGYGCIWVDGRSALAHRVSLELNGTTVPAEMYVDHRCRNRKCVRPEHLRIVTRKQNNEHLGPARSNNRSGYRGVCWQGSMNRWRASIRHHGSVILAGYFDDVEEAARAAQALRRDYFTHNDSDFEEIS